MDRNKKGKGPAKPKGIDLKRYFEVVGGHSSSNPSTRESGNDRGQSVNQNQVNTVEMENANSTPSEQVEEEIPDFMETVERVFSAMKIIKTELQSKMSGGCLNDLMVCYIERGIFKSLDLGKIKEAFQKKGRALPLPGSSTRH